MTGDAIWVTGLGAVTPAGWSADETWDLVSAGRSGISELRRFPLHGAATRVGGSVPGFEHSVPENESLALRFATGAIEEATRQAGIETGDADILVVGNHGERKLPLGGTSLVMTAQQLTETLRAQLGARYFTSVYGACAGGSLATGAGYQFLQSGLGDVAVVGGTDCLLRDFDFFQFCNLYAMTVRECDAQSASCPFDIKRDGFVLSEGAAFLVLETEAHARARGADPLAVVEGFGSAQNAYHIVASPPDARGPADAMAGALRDARLDVTDIGYINAHGTSTRDNDWCETLAIRHVFGPHADHLPISSSKSELGHTMAAAGAIEAVLSVLAIRNGVVPPTINLENPDDRCDLDYVPGVARERELTHVLSNSFGFGGHSTSLVFGRV